MRLKSHKPTVIERKALSVSLRVCDDDHGGPNNAASVYGHHGSRRTCIRIKDTDLWVFNPDWEDPR